MTKARGKVPMQQVERGTCLLGEGLVGGSGLNAEVLHAVDVVLVLWDCLRRCLSDSQQVQVAAVPLIEEQLVACRDTAGAAAWDGPGAARVAAVSTQVAAEHVARQSWQPAG